MSHEPIRFEQNFSASASQVWSAITDPDQMRQWFFEELEDFKTETGFQTQFEVDCEGKIYAHFWTVEDVLPEQRLVYRWHYGGVTGDSKVTWELSPIDDGGTQLKFAHEVIEPFPTDDPNFSREAGVEGWNYIINDRLTDFLQRQNS